MGEVSTLLIANRGEIALRIMRTAKRIGMRCVAVYSDADVDAPHVRAADFAVHIGGAPSRESYLRRDRVIAAAQQTGARIVHPGYGFLAEDDRFAKDCGDAGLTFVGPPSSVLRQVGDKASARALAEAAGVPVLVGYAGDDQSDEALLTQAKRIGFPVLVKPAAGGGGKGMAVVRTAAELVDALAPARRIASAAFFDDRLILERYIESPRHVEVQVMADAFGSVIHLGERDCSLQRRHQKILEETPAPNLDESVREALHAAAVAFARRAGYVGAGTCEFLVTHDGSFGFIEMNARLQVEHPVTEAVTGLDLVELQLRVALGEGLPFGQDDVVAKGHAVEVRLYAEDPRHGFVPQAGRIEHVRWPSGVRVDAGIEQGAVVSVHYDPMLAKIVTTGPDRERALDAMTAALSATQLLGVATNLPFLAGVVADDVVRGGRVSTDWLEGQDPARFLPAPGTPPAAVAAAASAESRRLRAGRSLDPFSRLAWWRAGSDGAARVVLRVDGQERVVAADETGDAPAARVGDTWLVWVDGDQHEIGVGPYPRSADAAAGAHLGSPLPGRVVAVHVGPGAEVAAGDELVTIEAMKMEHAIRAPGAGVVRAVLCAAGDQVERGQTLVDVEGG